VARCERLGFLRFHPVNSAIARLSVEECSSLRPDPADRIIVATALYLGASVITRDDKIRGSGVVRCLW
jgi:PIN domain nuclease of toxin-antitoxin system